MTVLPRLLREKDYTPAQRLLLLYLAARKPGGVAREAFMARYSLCERSLRRSVASLRELEVSVTVEDGRILVLE